MSEPELRYELDACRSHQRRLAAEIERVNQELNRLVALHVRRSGARARSWSFCAKAASRAGSSDTGMQVMDLDRLTHLSTLDTWAARASIFQGRYAPEPRPWAND